MFNQIILQNFQVLKSSLGTSLVVEWLGIQLAVQGTWFWSLVRKRDPTHHRAAKSTCHNSWSEVKEWSHSVVYDSATPWPARLFRPWDFPGKNTGVGCHFLLQGIFPTQGSNLGLLHCRQTLHHLSHQESHNERVCAPQWKILGDTTKTWCSQINWKNKNLAYTVRLKNTIFDAVE